MSESRSDDIGSTAPGRYGAQGSGVVLSAVTVAGAWNVQGDPKRASFVGGIEGLFGTALPLVSNTTTRGDALVALWLGPRSWLLLETSPVQRVLMHADFEAKRDSVNAFGGALFDVSASRVAYRVRGPLAAVVLAKSCPLDFGAEYFAVGACASSLFGHVNALFHCEDTVPTYLMLVARSLAADVWRTLCHSSAQYGYEVLAP